VAGEPVISFRILGPIEIAVAGRPIRLPAGHPRALLTWRSGRHPLDISSRPRRFVPRLEGTGRRVSVTGIDIFRMEGDRIAEFWTEFNLMDLAEQIGALPIAVEA
jgi:hypothetical protein